MKKQILDPFIAVCIIIGITFHAYAEEEYYFTVQLMATVAEATAKACSQQMGNKGIETFIEHPDNNTKATASFWKVKTGMFAIRTDAEHYAAELKSQGIDCWVTTTVKKPQKAQTLAQAVAVGDNSSAQNKKIVSKKADKPLPVTFTYRYFNPDDGAVHITSSLATIPARLRQDIREISVYPVTVQHLDPKTLLVTLAFGSETKKVRLVELEPPDRTIPPMCIASLETFLAGNDLRLKYFPARTSADGAVEGSLYLKNGDTLALEMVKRGIATYSPQSVQFFERHLFQEAKEKACREKLCIWENN